MPGRHEAPSQEKVAPITPQEAELAEKERPPNEVFEVFNQLIVENLRNGRARVMQKDAIDRLEARGFDRQALFDQHWLDVEPAYRSEGWRVNYDSPGYNETYEPSFKFEDRTASNRQ